MLPTLLVVVRGLTTLWQPWVSVAAFGLAVAVAVLIEYGMYVFAAPALVPHNFAGDFNGVGCERD